MTMPSTTWWRHQMETFSALLAICAGNSSVAVNSPHKGQRCGDLMFSLICLWKNGWVNNGEAGELRRYFTHYDVNVMSQAKQELIPWDTVCLVHFKRDDYYNLSKIFYNFTDTLQMHGHSLPRGIWEKSFSLWTNVSETCQVKQFSIDKTGAYQT